MDGMEARTSIDVAASPDQVWEVLVDVERWPEWTDSVSSVRPLDAGPLAVGSRVEISQPADPDRHVHGDGARTRQRLHLGAAAARQHGVCAPRVRLPDGGTRVELRVVMSGAVGGVVGRLYRKLTERYLAMEAAGLKLRAEGIAR
jgi:carbon monoxide dehydrogenase subunit G